MLDTAAFDFHVLRNSVPREHLSPTQHWWSHAVLVFSASVAIFCLVKVPVRAQQIQPSNSTASVSIGGSPVFRSGPSYLAGKYSDSVAVGDFNGDGKRDIVVSNEEEAPAVSGDVNILLGFGNGSFGRAVQYHAGNGAAHSIAVADFNGDGKDDLVVASACTFSSDIPFCEAHRMFSMNGTFPDYDVAWLSWPLSVATGDFNNDGKPDFAVAQLGADLYSQDSAVSIYLNESSDAIATYRTGGLRGYSVAIGDLNGDGNADLIVANDCADAACQTDSVSVLLGNGDGTFQPPASYISSAKFGWYDRQLVLADFNGDGRLDVSTTAGVFLGNGNGTLQPEISHAGSGAMAAADFNGDGFTDLATTGGLLLGNGDGTFTGPTSDVIGGTSLAAADFNRDGKPDLVVDNCCFRQNTSRITILLNAASGFRYATATTLESSLNPAPPGHMVTFTATITPAFSGGMTGVVNFMDGDTLLGSAPVRERRAVFSTLSLSEGIHFIRANYAGDTKFLPSRSTRLQQKIGP